MLGGGLIAAIPYPGYMAIAGASGGVPSSDLLGLIPFTLMLFGIGALLGVLFWWIVRGPKAASPA